MRSCAPDASLAVYTACLHQSLKSSHARCAIWSIASSPPIVTRCLENTTPACCRIPINGADFSMFKSVFICVCLCSLLFMPFTQSPQFDLLIKNGRIVDGSGRADYVADLAI